MNKYFFQNIHVISPLENIDITCNLLIDETGHISYPDESFKPSNDCIVIDAIDNWS
ncbi:MAG: hypothetical protein LW818_04810 [Ignavibacteriae bacterium]|nr:hypothetical protein [Ignavibacteriota bacterium]